MRSCGQGYAGIEKFTSLMNMPKPMKQNNYVKSAHIIIKAVQSVVEETIADSALKITNNAGDEIVNTSVFCDGRHHLFYHNFIIYIRLYHSLSFIFYFLSDIYVCHQKDSNIFCS